MAIYNKSDLLFNDYTWNESAEHVKLQGVPDRNMFMRYEGNEILYMINYACETMDCKSKTEAGRMEILLHEKLPLEVKSQNSVYSWLQKEYNLVLKEQ